MPMIRISHAAEYDQAKKEQILREVTAAYAEATGCDPAKVWVVLEEIHKSDWSTGGMSIASRAAQAS